MSESPVTIERLERAIQITAYVMQRHNLPQLFQTLKRLEAERERLVSEGDPIEYAKRILERRAIAIQPRRIDQRRDAA